MGERVLRGPGRKPRLLPEAVEGRVFARLGNRERVFVYSKDRRAALRKVQRKRAGTAIEIEDAHRPVQQRLKAFEDTFHDLDVDLEERTR